MSVRNELIRLSEELPSTVKLVAVSKFKPVSAIEQAYAAGQRIFAESRPQELAMKAVSLEKDIHWHFIGHLQTNKIKLILPIVSMIQSVDSEHLLEAINGEAADYGKVMDCLLEIHISNEPTKQGLSFDEAAGILAHLDRYPYINVKGFMGMASNTTDEGRVRQEFHSLKRFADNYPFLSELSMGMTNDYKLAISEGSTMVRIGTAIFGSR